MTARTVVPAAEAYELWAPQYDEENPVTLLESRAVRILSREEFTRLLDAGCGTGRRLPEPGPAYGIDLSLAMLLAGSKHGVVANADVRGVPFKRASFDSIWFRLAAGHIPDLRPVYEELGRVAASEAWLIVTDFHPEAARAGLRRTFKKDGSTFEVEHHVHGREDHLRAARGTGLSLRAELHMRLDTPTAEPFGLSAEKAERAGQVPLVLALAFEKGDGDS
jgi:malonyl-CoA O-methyltransferase